MKKKQNIQDYFIPGDYMDIKDGKTWRASIIKAVNKSNQTIDFHFQGWGEKWDENLKFTSYKIAFFRKHTTGYTGNDQFAVRTNIHLIEQELKENSQELDEIYNNNLEGMSPHEIIQKITGKHFYYCDFLLSLTNDKISQLKVEQLFI